jgi:hypothetical protein
MNWCGTETKKNVFGEVPWGANLMSYSREDSMNVKKG